ncbi:type IV secretion system protein [Stenotrophomonas maltophilia]|uniref:type IV secretion system protein n=1 Tax=Stenotrophomonas maltophilia TaxID=40324 RepID=UPI003D2F9827
MQQTPLGMRAIPVVMVSIVLYMLTRVSAPLWMTALLNRLQLMSASSYGMTSQAMQQGGMGLILTTLILTAPPMAAMFFQGTLGSFMAYSQIGGSAAATPGADGRPPGTYTPAAPSKQDSVNPETSNSAGNGRLTVPQGGLLFPQETGLRAANKISGN